MQQEKINRAKLEPKPVDWENTRLNKSRGNPEGSKPYPGLYDYHGFGYGCYFSKDGNRYWCDGGTANAMAHEDGVKFDYWDSLQGYKPVYLGD